MILFGAFRFCRCVLCPFIFVFVLCVCPFAMALLYAELPLNGLNPPVAGGFIPLGCVVKEGFLQ